MTTEKWAAKGQRVRAVWRNGSKPPLPGVRKRPSGVHEVVGVVEGVFGDAPRAADCTEVVYRVRPDDGGPVVTVKHNWVREVLPLGVERHHGE